MRNIFLQFLSDSLEVAVTLMSLCYWYRSFPHEWLHYQNSHFGNVVVQLLQIQWYNSFKLHPGNILNCADRFPGIWLNCLCHIPFGMLSPKMIVFTFLVCFLPVVIVATYDAFAGTTFLFAKPVCFSGWLLITPWRRLVDFGITEWFLKKFLSSGRVKNSFSVAGSSMQ